jgi:hypothetical protein
MSQDYGYGTEDVSTPCSQIVSFADYFRSRDREDGMQRSSRLLSVALVLGLTLPVFLGCLADEKPRPVKVKRTWNGTVEMELRKEAPESDFVADNDSWAKLWKAYRGEDPPEVDFDKELILVAVNRDPNQISIRPEVDGKGDLRVIAVSTLIGFTDPKTCAYQFALIKRHGIKTIKGKAIAKD